MAGRSRSRRRTRSCSYGASVLPAGIKELAGQRGTVSDCQRTVRMGEKDPEELRRGFWGLSPGEARES